MKKILRYNSLIKIHLQRCYLPSFPVLPEPSWYIEQDSLGIEQDRNIILNHDLILKWFVKSENYLQYGFDMY